MRKTIWFLVLAGMLISVSAMAADMFKATLAGDKSKATGEAVFTVRKGGKALEYKLTVKGLENPVAAHIHNGKPGTEGPPVVGLFSGKKKGTVNGTLAEGTITEKQFMGPFKGKTVADVIQLIKSGDAYVNVHTEKMPGGEIRGQIK